ncbi:MAG TPA: phosphatase PAP2 family protein [Verrucomicrobiota bacterium]|nr:phosphatase PAP2 family protein [Verrucomicrobiota bacterium]
MNPTGIIHWCFRWPGFRLLLIPVMMFATGCGTLQNGRGWGEDAIYPVKWERVKQAAKNAVLDPVTWISAGGAAIFAIDDFDEKTSNWATKHTPVFGSESRAADMGEDLVNVIQAGTVATWLATPSGKEFPEWAWYKTKGGLVEFGAIEAVSALTSFGKDTTGRTRPDGKDDRSFPSADTSKAFASARLSNRNLDSIDMSPWVRTSLKAANLVLASGTAWSRVEGNRHYPSDVLVGAALGNMVTIFIHDAFMNLPDGKESDFSFYIEPSPSHIIGGVSWEF